MATLDLDPRHLDLVRSLAATHLTDAEVWAYGSRVVGGAHAGSDLDMVVRNRTDPLVPCAGLAAFRAALSESNLPILTDVRDWALIPPEFRRRIEAHHVTVWACRRAPNTECGQ